MKNRRLILVRHAKSSWEHEVEDHERPLNTRGFKDAHKISEAIIGDFNPDLILISDAVRTRYTAEIFLKNLHFGNKNIFFSNKLYDFSGSNLLEVVKTCHKDVTELMVFGHNNAITNVVNTYGDVVIDNVPTCGVTVIEFEIKNWSDLKKGKTIRTLFPRDLK